MQATFQQTKIGSNASAGNDRPVGKAIKRGLLNRCPACGEGRLFRAFLKPVDACSVCGEEMLHHRADDLPPYIVITIVGHIVVAGYMMTDLIFPFPTWVHLAIWAPLTLLGALGLMQPVKGGVVGLQWALRMHGFGSEADKLGDDITLHDPAA